MFPFTEPTQSQHPSSCSKPGVPAQGEGTSITDLFLEVCSHAGSHCALCAPPCKRLSQKGTTVVSFQEGIELLSFLLERRQEALEFSKALEHETGTWELQGL